MQTGGHGRAGAPVLTTSSIPPQVLSTDPSFALNALPRRGFGKLSRHCLSNPATNNLKLDIHGVPLCPSLLGMALMMLCQHNYSYCSFLLPKYPV